jgi:hypothetical protein
MGMIMHNMDQGNNTTQTTASENQSRPDIHKRRYALDEIDRAQFEEMMRQSLGQADSPVTAPAMEHAHHQLAG